MIAINLINIMVSYDKHSNLNFTKNPDIISNRIEHKLSLRKVMIKQELQLRRARGNKTETHSDRNETINNIEFKKLIEEYLNCMIKNEKFYEFKSKIKTLVYANHESICFIVNKLNSAICNHSKEMDIERKKSYENNILLLLEILRFICQTDQLSIESIYYLFQVNSKVDGTIFPFIYISKNIHSKISKFNLILILECLFEDLKIYQDNYQFENELSILTEVVEDILMKIDTTMNYKNLDNYYTIFDDDFANSKNKVSFIISQMLFNMILFQHNINLNFKHSIINFISTALNTEFKFTTIKSDHKKSNTALDIEDNNESYFLALSMKIIVIMVENETSTELIDYIVNYSEIIPYLAFEFCIAKKIEYSSYLSTLISCVSGLIGSILFYSQFLGRLLELGVINLLGKIIDLNKTINNFYIIAWALKNALNYDVNYSQDNFRIIKQIIETGLIFKIYKQLNSNDYLVRLKFLELLCVLIETSDSTLLDELSDTGIIEPLVDIIIGDINPEIIHLSLTKIYVLMNITRNYENTIKFLSESNEFISKIERLYFERYEHPKLNCNCSKFSNKIETNIYNIDKCNLCESNKINKLIEWIMQKIDHEKII